MKTLLAVLVLWQGETLYYFGEVSSPLVVRRGQIVAENGYPDKVVWGAGSDVAEIVANVPPGDYGEVRVLSRKMPPLRESGYHLDLWQHPWAVARTEKCRPFSSAHYDAMRPFWEMLADAGQKSLTVTLVPLPWNHQCYDGYGSMVAIRRRAAGGWEFDFEILDEYVAFGKSCGIGPYISAYTMCPWGNVYRFTDEEGKDACMTLVPGTREYGAFWREYLAALAAHLRLKGWLETAFIALDERAPEEVAAIVELAHEAGFKVQLASDRDWRAYAELPIDNYSQSVEFAADDGFREWARMRRAQGLITTYYVCCHPKSPNTFIFSPREEPFRLGHLAAENDSSGFLRWAYNSWPEDPDRDAAYGNWPAGDTFLVYPDGSPSVRFLELRNGISAAVKEWQ